MVQNLWEETKILENSNFIRESAIAARGYSGISSQENTL